ncbi:exostosin-3 [Paramuricea clavata]|uniref:Exostosin-3 n=1 Tax=Paramuricea clavata TaxID=317549 RepID=A0A6S7LN79_PARCT|nr:exostosin-3 [Paramuricea clavata]
MNMLALFYKLKDSNYGRFLLLLLCLIAVMPFVTHYYLTKRAGTQDFYSKSFHTRSALQDDDSNTEYRLEELRKNINELEHVKLSLKNELRELEGKRHGLLRNIQEHSNNIDNIVSKANYLTNEVTKQQQELEDLRFAKKMVSHCPQLPLVKPPKDILSKLSHKFQTYPQATVHERTHCKLSSCFNFQKCPLGRDFTAHIYNPKNTRLSMRTSVSQEMYSILKSMPYAVDVNEPTACVYIVILDTLLDSSPKELEKFLHNLEFWQGDGHNHIIINFAGGKVLHKVDTGRAILAQTMFGPHTPYRREFDMVVPPLASLTRSGSPWENSAPQLPASRKYLVSFVGNYHSSKKGLNNDSFISVGDLKQLSLEAKDIFIQLSCQPDKEFANSNDWQLCGSHKSRAEVLKASTFALIFQSEHAEDQTMTIIRFIEALQYGAIPVVISDNILLPFTDIIEWHRAAIMLHSAQFPQMHFILRTILVNDVLDIRRQGRFLWEAYLSSAKSVLESTMAVIQTRLSLPGVPAKDTHFPSVFYSPDPNLVMQHGITSPTFYRNFTANTIYARQRWNTYPGALLLFPSSPIVPVLPSSAAFLNSSFDIQPIGRGAGGAGREFQEALGGDYPFEQFTIVMLTYERELVLIEALGRLAGLQYMNKVVVVWNSPGDPSPDLRWPNIGVPIKVLRPEKNSLNNRFLPLDEIETDAVLSMDDDIQLRHDEILFGFRYCQ